MERGDPADIDTVAELDPRPETRTFTDDEIEAYLEASGAGSVDVEPIDYTPEEIDELLSRQLGPRVIFDDPTRITDGATWLLGVEEQMHALWGDAKHCAWAEGEGLMIAGGQGVGKSTIAQQLALARIGILGEVLGMPVVPGRKNVLYIAGDRPRQAQRSMRRMVNSSMEQALRDRLRVWRGPLPQNVVERPTMLREMAEHCGADTVIIDSLKDVALDLSNETSGQRINESVQLCVVEDIQVLELHHQRKEGDESKGKGRPGGSIDSIYGSTWITSGLGSVMYLAGKPGDTHVTLRHLKQPAENVGPIEIIHDHATGMSRVDAEADPLEIVRTTPGGADANTLARALNEGEDPDRNDVERARRKLKKLLELEHVEMVEVDGSKGKARQVFRARVNQVEGRPGHSALRWFGESPTDPF